MSPHKEKFILHIDMDAFFAAVEQRDRPELIGKPVIIGADPKAGKGRGVVATCSYEARVFGIRSAMPISLAYRKCPHGVYILPDMNKYEEVSSRLYELFLDFTPEVEPISIDEAFLDITGSYHLFGTPLSVCHLIKNRIKDKIGLTASIGMASTKMTAKIASDLEKPDGLVVVRQGESRSFLENLEISRLWGVGPKTKEVFENKGIRTIGDLAKMKRTETEDRFGTQGLSLWELANGIDDRMVQTNAVISSLSNEETFETDNGNTEEIERSLMVLTEKVSLRLRDNKMKCRTITLKIRTSDFKTFTRSKTISESTNHVEVIYSEIKKLYHEFMKRKNKIRLVGIKASKLSSASKIDFLFESEKNVQSEKIHSVVDNIRNKFGDSYISRAKGI